MVCGLHKECWIRCGHICFVVGDKIRYGQRDFTVSGGLVKKLLVHSQMVKSRDLVESARMCQNMTEA